MKTSSRGFLHIILIIVIALIILGYFGLNIQEILAKPVVHDNLVWFWDFLKTVWGYIKDPVMWFWDHVITFLWNLFVQGLGNLNNGGGVESLNVPTVGN